MRDLFIMVIIIAFILTLMILAMLSALLLSEGLVLYSFLVACVAFVEIVAFASTDFYPYTSSFSR